MLQLMFCATSCNSNDSKQYSEKTDTTAINGNDQQKTDSISTGISEDQIQESDKVDFNGIQVPKVTILPAADITLEYLNDPKNADIEYKNKILLIKGVVKEINKDKSNRIFVLLSGHNKFKNVQCYLAKPENESYVSIGKEVMLKGECTGFKKNVIIVNCEPMVEFNLQETLDKIK